MKLYKALKLRKTLISEIAELKRQIKEKNSYLEGDLNAEKFDVHELYNNLLKKINELIGLKFAINIANSEIQSKLYVLSEYKEIIKFWNEVSVVEGVHIHEIYEPVVRNYKVQIDENERNKIIKEFQKRINAIQEEIDIYNYTTDIAWDETESE